MASGCNLWRLQETRLFSECEGVGVLCSQFHAAAGQLCQQVATTVAWLQGMLIKQSVGCESEAWQVLCLCEAPGKVQIFWHMLEPALQELLLHEDIFFPSASIHAPSLSRTLTGATQHLASMDLEWQLEDQKDCDRTVA